MDAILLSGYTDDNSTGSCMKYKLMNISNTSYRAKTNPMVISMPEMNQPIVMNFSGRVNNISISWKIVDAGSTDLSFGTYNSSVSSIMEQIKYLQTYFISADITSNIGIKLLDDNGNVAYETYGIPNGFSWTWAGGEMAVSATVSFIENLVSDLSC